MLPPKGTGLGLVSLYKETVETWTAFIFGTFGHRKVSQIWMQLTNFDQIKSCIILTQTSIIAHNNFCKNLGRVNTFKLAPTSSLESSLIPQCADIGFNIIKIIFGQAFKRYKSKCPRDVGLGSFPDFQGCPIGLYRESGMSGRLWLGYKRAESNKCFISC